MFFIAERIACSTCFGHHYAHHQELESIIQMVGACGIWCFVFQLVGMVWSWGLCVRFAGCCKEATLIKFVLFTSLLSLGGLPPFLGFLPKWIAIQTIITNSIAPLATVVVVTSLITLYYYLKISYSRFIILSTEPKWNLKFHKNKSTKNTWTLILSSSCLVRFNRQGFVGVVTCSYCS
jgi:NADH:ubiquinone oxidoreductase subunit 2 (subunit N)